MTGHTGIVNAVNGWIYWYFKINLVKYWTISM